MKWGNTFLYLYIYQYIALFTVVVQDIPVVIITQPGQDAELICDVNDTEASTRWQINGSSSLVSLSELSNGAVAGHDVSGRNIVVVKDIMMNDVRNVVQYQCVSLTPPITAGDLVTLYVASECND